MAKHVTITLVFALVKLLREPITIKVKLFTGSLGTKQRMSTG